MPGAPLALAVRQKEYRDGVCSFVVGSVVPEKNSPTTGFVIFDPPRPGLQQGRCGNGANKVLHKYVITLCKLVQVLLQLVRLQEEDRSAVFYYYCFHPLTS